MGLGIQYPMHSEFCKVLTFLLETCSDSVRVDVDVDVCACVLLLTSFDSAWNTGASKIRSVGKLNGITSNHWVCAPCFCWYFYIYSRRWCLSARYTNVSHFGSLLLSRSPLYPYICTHCALMYGRCCEKKHINRGWRRNWEERDRQWHKSKGFVHYMHFIQCGMYSE